MIHTLSVFNAGVWGGHISTVSCLLNCIAHDLITNLKGKGNCNMGTVNWCIRFSNCSSKSDLERDNVKELFVNPFRKECDNRKYGIIHNKCKRTEGNVCLIIQNNEIHHHRSKDRKSCQTLNK